MEECCPRTRRRGPSQGFEVNHSFFGDCKGKKICCSPWLLRPCHSLQNELFLLLETMESFTRFQTGGHLLQVYKTGELFGNTFYGQPHSSTTIFGRSLLMMLDSGPKYIRLMLENFNGAQQGCIPAKCCVFRTSSITIGFLYRKYNPQLFAALAWLS